MFGLSVWEIAFVLLLGFIVLGPRKLPEVAQSMAGFVREFQKHIGQWRVGFDEVLREPVKHVPVQTVTPSDTEPSTPEKPSDTPV
jgi:Sec-independent protein translocase protein TatA